MNKKHYLVYKTTCLVNGKIYIGQHQTYDPNDNYLGSGRELRVDIQKFGRENFTREILFDFDTFEEMDNKEKELVTEEFVNRKDTYNVRLGGQNPEVDRICAMGREKERQLWEENGEWANKTRKRISESAKRTWEEHRDTMKCPHLDWTGRHHTKETRDKMSRNTKKKFGEMNPQFGMRGIHNESLRQTIRVKISEVDAFLANGWHLGEVHDWDRYFQEKEERLQKEQKRQLQYEEQKRKYTEMYKVYCELGFDGVREKFGYKFSQPNFVTQCQKYVDEFKPQTGKPRKQ